MEDLNQSVQESSNQERKQAEYKTIFLKKRTVTNCQSVYISGDIQNRIAQIVGIITSKQVSIGNFIDNVL